MANQTANGPVWSFTTSGTQTSPPPPPPPVLLTDSATGRAMVVQSPLLTREPFTISSFNLMTDQRTRVMLFAQNIDPNTPLTSLIVTAVSAQGVHYQLPVEYLGAMPGTQSAVVSIIVRLPEDATLHGDLTLNLTVGTNHSNNVVFGVQ